MTGTTNNRREDSPGSIVSGKASFAHSWSIVNNKSSNFVVTHFELGLACNCKKTNVNWVVLVLHIRKGLRVKVNVCTILESPEGGRCGCSKNLSPMKPIRATEGTVLHACRKSSPYWEDKEEGASMTHALSMPWPPSILWCLNGMVKKTPTTIVRSVFPKLIILLLLILTLLKGFKILKSLKFLLKLGAWSSFGF